MQYISIYRNIDIFIQYRDTILAFGCIDHCKHGFSNLSNFIPKSIYTVITCTCVHACHIVFIHIVFIVIMCINTKCTFIMCINTMCTFIMCINTMYYNLFVHLLCVYLLSV